MSYVYVVDTKINYGITAKKLWCAQPYRHTGKSKHAQANFHQNYVLYPMFLDGFDEWEPNDSLLGSANPQKHTGEVLYILN